MTASFAAAFIHRANLRLVHTTKLHPQRRETQHALVISTQYASLKINLQL